MALLTSANFPDVRAALDSGLTTTEIEDSTIALTIYQDAANQDVLKLDPAAASRTGDDGAAILRAAIYFCAARLAPVVIRITSLSVTTRDMTFSKKTFDPEVRAAELRELAFDELDEVLGTTTDLSGIEAGVLQMDYQQTDRITDLP